MRLEALLDGTDCQVVGSTQDKDIKSLIYHSDEISAGSMFFAINGTETDGKKYIKKALEKGAIAIVTEECGAEILNAAAEYDAAVVLTADVRKALAEAMFGDGIAGPVYYDMIILGHAADREQHRRRIAPYSRISLPDDFAAIIPLERGHFRTLGVDDCGRFAANQMNLCHNNASKLDFVLFCI